MSSSGKTMTVYYDGSCFMCENYATYIKLRAKYDLNILNARENLDEITKIAARSGKNINAGFIVVTGDDVFIGREAMVYLESLITPKNFLERLLNYIRGHKALSYLVYPFAKAVRSIILKLKGIEGEIVGK